MFLCLSHTNVFIKIVTINIHITTHATVATAETAIAHLNFKGLGCAVAFLCVYKFARLPKSSVNVSARCIDRAPKGAGHFLCNYTSTRKKHLL